MTEEVWKSHPKYGDLVQASSLGRVRQFLFNQKRWALLKQRPHKNGYLRVTLAYPLGSFILKVSHVVAEAWYGPRPMGLEIAHKNGNRTDNRPANLMFCTRRANALHKRAHGVWPCPAIAACERAAVLLCKERRRQAAQAAQAALAEQRDQRVRRLSDRRDEILATRRLGMTSEAAASSLGLGSSQVRKVWRSAGIGRGYSRSHLRKRTKEESH